MNGIGALVIIVLILAPIALVIWLITQTNEARRRLEELARRLASVELDLHLLKRGEKDATAPATAPTATPPPVAELLKSREAQRTQPAAPPTFAPGAAPPPLAATTTAAPRTGAPQQVPPPLAPAPVRTTKPAFNLEHFLGVKMFAWIGGFIAFLVVAFVLKESFDRGWITPPLRIALGYVTGAGLLFGAFRLSRERYAVTVQTLCGAAALICYGTTFAAHGLYDLFPVTLTFALMTAVTAGAFFLAVRLGAQVVAVLGMLGGFLTPVLLSTGEDRPGVLFTYIALLDLGLVAVALRQRWNHLVPLGALGTALMQLGWYGKFFAAEKLSIGIAIFAGFAWLFAGALAAARRWRRDNGWLSAAVLVASGVAYLFALGLLSHRHRHLADPPGTWLLLLLLIDLALIAAATVRSQLRLALAGAGGATFFCLAVWTGSALAAEQLNWALGAYFVFAALHTVYPLVLERLRPAGQRTWWAHLFPPLALLMILLPMARFNADSWVIWPVVLLVDLLAIGLAVITASLTAVVVVLVLSLGLLGYWLAHVPAELTGLPEALFLIGGFAVFFFAATLFAGRRLAARLAQPAVGNALTPLNSEAATHLPAFSALLPFLLLAMAVVRMPLADPTPVFGLAAGLLVLLLGLVRFFKVDALCAVGLVAAFLLEQAWQAKHFDPANAQLALAWHLAFPTLFFVFPFLFRARFAERVFPWAASALALPLHFGLVRHATTALWPENPWPGLVPAVLALPPLAALGFLARDLAADAPKRNTVLALFGGVALFFLTLIFPIQFEKQWLTVGWALEGAALLWLFHRVPHNGLRIVGGALLVVAFARLALNPAVFVYHARTPDARPILNWFLYSYGIVTVALFAGARLLAPPRERVLGLNLRALLATLGTVLAFLLVNIEIADAFSTGTRIEFRFSGNLARDMTHSLAWALFAAVLLVAGVRKSIAASRYAGLGLLVVTILKLFLHDLWQLRGLYRIGSLIGLAVTLMLVSFLYQKFLAGPGRKGDAEK